MGSPAAIKELQNELAEHIDPEFKIVPLQLKVILYNFEHLLSERDRLHANVEQLRTGQRKWHEDRRRLILAKEDLEGKLGAIDRTRRGVKKSIHELVHSTIDEALDVQEHKSTLLNKLTRLLAEEESDED